MTTLSPATDTSPIFGLLESQLGMRSVLDSVTRVLGLPIDVLVAGESGTGKELVARLLHEADPLRGDHAFVPLNCAALPEALLEADLFGHRSGAFTGATHDRQGLFHQAQGGTLFLDEIGEMPPTLQPKLLRALQERAVRRVGGTEEEPVDVRVVSATNRDLSRAMEEGQFRRDLYYRLADFVVDLPPLRQRRSDITGLAYHFLTDYRSRFARLHVRRLEDEALTWLRRRDWRGNNVRELSIAVKRAVLLCDGPAITAQHLQAAIARDHVAAGGADRLPVDEPRLLADALERTGGNLAATARLLDMKRSTLFDRLRRYGIRRP